MNLGEKVDRERLVPEEEADDFLGLYLEREPAVRQNRAILKDVRYVIFKSDGELQAVEEEGEWESGILEPRDENTYNHIKRNGKGFEEEEIEVGKAEALYL